MVSFSTLEIERKRVQMGIPFGYGEMYDDDDGLVLYKGVMTNWQRVGHGTRVLRYWRVLHEHFWLPFTASFDYGYPSDPVNCMPTAGVFDSLPLFHCSLLSTPDNLNALVITRNKVCTWNPSLLFLPPLSIVKSHYARQIFDSPTLLHAHPKLTHQWQVRMD